MNQKRVLYIEIAETIKNDIQNNRYLVGSMLPTENEFEAMFDVSKITIRKAIEVLALQGYVEKKSGKGTTVISNRLFNKLSKGDSFSTLLEKKGLDIEKKILSITEVALIKNSEYYPFFGNKATKITRIYLADGNPYILFNHFLPGEVSQAMKTDLPERSMYRILAEENFLVNRFEDKFLVSAIDEAEQELLQTKESHVMKRERTSFNNQDEIIEVSISLYNTALHPYEMKFEI